MASQLEAPLSSLRDTWEFDRAPIQARVQEVKHKSRTLLENSFTYVKLKIRRLQTEREGGNEGHRLSLALEKILAGLSNGLTGQSVLSHTARVEETRSSGGSMGKAGHSFLRMGIMRSETSTLASCPVVRLPAYCLVEAEAFEN